MLEGSHGENAHRPWDYKVQHGSVLLGCILSHLDVQATTAAHTASAKLGGSRGRQFWTLREVVLEKVKLQGGSFANVYSGHEPPTINWWKREESLISQTLPPLTSS